MIGESLSQNRDFTSLLLCQVLVNISELLTLLERLCELLVLTILFLSNPCAGWLWLNSLLKDALLLVLTLDAVPFSAHAF